MSGGGGGGGDDELRTRIVATDAFSAAINSYIAKMDQAVGLTKELNRLAKTRSGLSGSKKSMAGAAGQSMVGRSAMMDHQATDADAKEERQRLKNLAIAAAIATDAYLSLARAQKLTENAAKAAKKEKKRRANEKEIRESNDMLAAAGIPTTKKGRAYKRATGQMAKDSADEIKRNAGIPVDPEDKAKAQAKRKAARDKARQDQRERDAILAASGIPTTPQGKATAQANRKGTRDDKAEEKKRLDARLAAAGIAVTPDQKVDRRINGAQNKRNKRDDDERYNQAREDQDLLRTDDRYGKMRAEVQRKRKKAARDAAAEEVQRDREMARGYLRSNGLGNRTTALGRATTAVENSRDAFRRRQARDRGNASLNAAGIPTDPEGMAAARIARRDAAAQRRRDAETRRQERARNAAGNRSRRSRRRGMRTAMRATARWAGRAAGAGRAAAQGVGSGVNAALTPGQRLFTSAGSAAAAFTRQLYQIERGIMAIRTAAAAATQPAAYLVNKSSEYEDRQIALAGQIEAYRTDKPDWGGSMDLAAMLSLELQRAADTLPGEFEHYAEAFKMNVSTLSAAGVTDPHKQVDTTKNFLGSAMALGVDGAQAGRDLQMMLSGRAGNRVKSYALMKPLMGEGAQDAKSFNKLKPEERLAAINKAVAEYGPMLEAFQNTFTAQKGALKSNLNILAVKASEPLYRGMIGMMTAVNAHIGSDTFREKWIGRGRALSSKLLLGATGKGVKAAGYVNELKGMDPMTRLAKVMGDLTAVCAPLAPVLGGFLAMLNVATGMVQAVRFGEAFQQAKFNFIAALPAARELGRMASEVMMAGGKSMADMFFNVAADMTVWVDILKDKFGPVVGNITSGFDDIVKKLGPAITQLLDTVVALGLVFFGLDGSAASASKSIDATANTIGDTLAGAVIFAAEAVMFFADIAWAAAGILRGLASLVPGSGVAGPRAKSDAINDLNTMQQSLEGAQLIKGRPAFAYANEADLATRVAEGAITQGQAQAITQARRAMAAHSVVLDDEGIRGATSEQIAQIERGTPVEDVISNETRRIAEQQRLINTLPEDALNDAPSKLARAPIAEAKRLRAERIAEAKKRKLAKVDPPAFVGPPAPPVSTAELKPPELPPEAPGGRGGRHYDFRFSRFSIEQIFDEGMDADRVKAIFTDDLAREAEFRSSNGLRPVTSQ